MNGGDKVAATARRPETLGALVDVYGGAVLPILKVVDVDEPPPRVFFGEAPPGIATKDYE